MAQMRNNPKIDDTAMMMIIAVPKPRPTENKKKCVMHNWGSYKILLKML